MLLELIFQTHHTSKADTHGIVHELIFWGEKKWGKTAELKGYFQKTPTSPPSLKKTPNPNQKNPNPSQPPPNREETHTDPVLVIHLYLLLEWTDVQFSTHMLEIRISTNTLSNH